MLESDTCYHFYVIIKFLFIAKIIANACGLIVANFPAVILETWDKQRGNFVGNF